MGRIVKGNREAGPQLWYHIGAAQKDNMDRIVKRNREAGPQLWCHIGTAQKKHGSHCKGEQGGRAPIVVPHKEYTHTHPLDRNGLLGLQIHITCMGPGTNHGPRSALVGDVKAVLGESPGP